MTQHHPTTVAMVNQALALCGRRERLVHRIGDTYAFEGGTAARWPEAGVYVRHVSDLSLHQWIKQYDTLYSRYLNCDTRTKGN